MFQPHSQSSTESDTRNQNRCFDLFCGDTNGCDWIASCFPLKEVKSKD